ncbi:hypothetical protein NN561_017060 [Cricetulus griseus]
MFSWLKKGGARGQQPEAIRTVTSSLKELYRTKLLPLEEHYRFGAFHSPALEDADFDGKPMVLVAGQYSTGKTSFIQYLLEQEVPGSRVGPEPTTDCFVAVMHGETEGTVPGNALVVDPEKPFRKLNPFGNTFLNRFMCAQLPNQVLESISIIDTPGILSGAKQRVSRGYDFPAVLRWFAERVDLIILLFDAHKLEISDEFSEAIGALRGHEDKIRVVLNKADMVETQQLMRVYGALMWALGKVVGTPEVLRVYIGSFWSQPLLVPDNRHLFELEEQDLFRDIQGLPRHAALRKLNDLVKRARLVRVHAYIISYLKKEMPSVFGKENKKKQLILKLPVIFAKIQLEHHISPGDFPDCQKMQELLMAHDFTKFHSLKPKLLEALDEMLTHDIAKLMPLLRQEELESVEAGVQGGAFEGTHMGPFVERGPDEALEDGEEGSEDDAEWVVTKDKSKYDEIFYNLAPADGKLSGSTAKTWMVGTKLPNSVLGRIWKLSDVDRDGMLDDEEFALASHLIESKLEGHGLPTNLPRRLVPPSKRRHKGSADGLLAEAPNEKLFFVDTGSKKKGKERFCDLGILAHQVPNAKKLRRKEQLWEKLAKQGELPREVRKAQARLLSPPAPKAKRGLQDIIERPFYDLWNPNNPLDKPLAGQDAFFLEQTKKKGVRRPPRLHVKPSQVPAVEVTPAGASYNPTFEDHQALLLKAHEVEVQREKDSEKLERQLALPTVEQAATQRVQQAALRAARLQHQELFRLRGIKAQVARRLMELARRKEQRRLRRLAEANKPRRLGRLKYQDPDIDVQLSSELSDSLRTLKCNTELPVDPSAVQGLASFSQALLKSLPPVPQPEGNILRDRFKSFQKRNMIEPRERAKFKRKYKVKMVEKRSFREMQPGRVPKPRSPRCPALPAPRALGLIRSRRASGCAHGRTRRPRRPHCSWVGSSHGAGMRSAVMALAVRVVYCGA